MNLKNYLISTGLNSLLKNRFNLELNLRTQDQIIYIENNFNDEMKKIIQKENVDYSFEVYTEKDIIKDAKELLKESKNPLIVYDDVYGINGDAVISSTRLTNPVTLENRIGERPGSKPLDYQRNLIKEKFAGKTVDIYDIGIFEGETLKEEIVTNLPNAGINIGKVFINIGNESAIENLSKYVEIVTARSYNFGEWLENRDPFLLDGRKVLRNDLYENILKKDQLIIPYICNNEWSSISEENFEEYKNLCKNYNGQLLNILKESNHILEKKIISRYDNGIYVEKLSVK